MPSLNDLTIIGNVGNDPEMRYTPGGKAVTNFSVAVNTKKGDEKITTWFKVSCWDRLAETANEYLSKGKAVYLRGPVSVSMWTDSKSGDPRADLCITAYSMVLLGSKDDEQQQQPRGRNTGRQGQPRERTVDDFADDF